jgi:hypothetical protein
VGTTEVCRCKVDVSPGHVQRCVAQYPLQRECVPSSPVTSRQLDSGFLVSLAQA